MALPAIKFDTLSVSQELEKAGLPKAHAQACVAATVKVVNMAIEEKLVTKADLQHTEKSLRQEIGRAEKSLRQEIERVEKTLYEEISRVEKTLSERIHALEIRMIALENKVDKLALQMTVRLGGLMVLGITVIEILNKL